MSLQAAADVSEQLAKEQEQEVSNLVSDLTTVKRELDKAQDCCDGLQCDLEAFSSSSGAEVETLQDRLTSERAQSASRLAEVSLVTFNIPYRR